MHHKGRFPNVFFGANLRPDSAALAIMVLLLFLILVLLFMTLIAQPVQAQTYEVIHNFTGGADGGQPTSGLTMDAAGDFYGTSTVGGYFGGNCYYGCGTVFKLSHNGSGWVLTQIYAFRGGNDGAYPAARVIIGPDGSLYGTTYYGGGDGCDGSGCGTVFNLKAAASVPPNIFGRWVETVLYSFAGGSDGVHPELGDLIFDRAGNIFGTTPRGGGLGYCTGDGCGVAYQLTPVHGTWTENILYRFTGGSDGGSPYNGVILDETGSLYGIAMFGGRLDCSNFGYLPGCGTVFALRPSGSGWVENTLYTFQGGSDGQNPVGGLTLDPAGTFYGTTTAGGSGGGGTVFTLSSGCLGWQLATLYSFSGYPYMSGPLASLTVDALGSLYGTTTSDGAYRRGNVFKLTRSAPTAQPESNCTATNPDAVFTYTSLHDFYSDGIAPYSNVTLAPNGKLYGTTYIGGTGSACINGCGVVWEITP